MTHQAKHVMREPGGIGWTFVYPYCCAGFFGLGALGRGVARGECMAPCMAGYMPCIGNDRRFAMGIRVVFYWGRRDRLTALPLFPRSPIASALEVEEMNRETFVNIVYVISLVLGTGTCGPPWLHTFDFYRNQRMFIYLSVHVTMGGTPLCSSPSPRTNGSSLYTSCLT
jgi:hypothetical protein